MGLLLEPSKIIVFRGPFDKPVTSVIKMTNISKQRHLYKVKTTVPTEYCVRPTYGIIFPKESKNICLRLQSSSTITPDTKHMFMIVFLLCPKGDYVNFYDMWSKAEKTDKPVEYKLRCEFIFPPEYKPEPLPATSSNLSAGLGTSSQAQRSRPPLLQDRPVDTDTKKLYESHDSKELSESVIFDPSKSAEDSYSTHLESEKTSMSSLKAIIENTPSSSREVSKKSYSTEHEELSKTTARSADQLRPLTAQQIKDNYRMAEKSHSAQLSSSPSSRREPQLTADEPSSAKSASSSKETKFEPEPQVEVDSEPEPEPEPDPEPVPAPAPKPMPMPKSMPKPTTSSTPMPRTMPLPYEDKMGLVTLERRVPTHQVILGLACLLIGIFMGKYLL